MDKPKVFIDETLVAPSSEEPRLGYVQITRASVPSERCNCAAKRLHARAQERNPGSKYRFAHHPTCPDAQGPKLVRMVLLQDTTRHRVYGRFPWPPWTDFPLAHDQLMAIHNRCYQWWREGKVSW